MRTFSRQDSQVLERRIFFNYNFFLQDKTWLDRKLNFLTYKSDKNSNFSIYLNPSLKHPLYLPTNREKLVFQFQIELLKVIVLTARIPISKRSPGQSIILFYGYLASSTLNQVAKINKQKNTHCQYTLKLNLHK